MKPLFEPKHFPKLPKYQQQFAADDANYRIDAWLKEQPEVFEFCSSVSRTIEENLWTEDKIGNPSRRARLVDIEYVVDEDLPE